MPSFDDAYLEDTLRHVFEDPTLYKLPRGVLRYDYAQTHGWWVRVTRDKAHFRKIFSESVHGSIELALRLAILYRHEILSSFPVTIKSTNSRNLLLEPESRIVLQEDKGKDRPYQYWMAKWYDANHKIKTKRFFVLKHGFNEARQLALETAKKNHNPAPKLVAVPDAYEDENWREISRQDVDILSTINGSSYSRNGKFTEAIANSFPFGYEGERRLQLHMGIERDKTLRTKKIAEILDRNGRLFCELCHFNFLSTFPFLSKDIIEVHHIQPLATLSSNTKIETSDLMLLCSNCHTAVHQGDAVENLRRAVELFNESGMRSDG